MNDPDTAWEYWVAEVYQLAGAILLAPDHYTAESLESLKILLLDALSSPMSYSDEQLRAEWKRRAVVVPTTSYRSGVTNTVEMPES